MELDHVALAYEGRWGPGTVSFKNAEKFLDELPITVRGFGERVPEVVISPNPNSNGKFFMEIDRRIALLGLEGVSKGGYELRFLYDGIDGQEGPELHIYKGLALIVKSRG